MMNVPETTPEVHRCLRPGCGRKLSSPESIARGFGGGCWRKVRQAEKSADLSAWTPQQVEQARELIEDGALVPAGREGVFLAVSTDGGEVYRVTAGLCQCPAGEKGHQCYHRCAVAIVIAASAAPAPAPAAVLVPAPASAADDIWTRLEAVGATGADGFIPAF